MSTTKKKKTAVKSKTTKPARTRAKAATARPTSKQSVPRPRASTAKTALNRAVEHSQGKNRERMVLANTRVTPDVKSRAEKICEERGTNLTSYMRESINQLVESYAA